MKDQEKKAVVAGAGLVGCLWAILLGKRGYHVDIYERRGDMRDANIVGGRSINLAMSTRGWKAIEKAGIKDKIEKVAIPMKGRMMHSEAGDLTFQPYGKEGEAIYSVSRAGLNIELMNLADEYDNVQFHFHKKCTGIGKNTAIFRVQDTITNEKSNIEAPLIFGADGAFSAVRSTLQKTSRFNYSQQYLDHGYKELTIPANADGSFAMDKHSLHIWPRGQFMMIALPNADGSFTCTLFLPFKGKESFSRLKNDGQILAFFNKYFKDSIPLMPTLLEDFNENPTSSLVTIRCNPWKYRDRILLMGDASHAIVPFYGQGMNSGFEDCSILDELTEKHEENWPAILTEFNDIRIQDADAIAELAVRNFIEMRDLVGDPEFLLRKKIAAHFHKKYPNDFIPLYSMVTFSHIPYHKALEEGKAQDQLFAKILAVENIEEKWDGPEVETIFKSWLENK